MLDVAIANDSDAKACSYDVKWSESKPRYFTGPAGPALKPSIVRVGADLTPPNFINWAH